ncbi:MAG: flagellar export chaperone FlgN, partial [Planctomycetes bacterium]|nr:flagellar export chaperone FlgN [Planctomycetota bacterium]
MTGKDVKALRLKIAVEDLCEILSRLEERHGRLCDVLAAKERALVEVAMDAIESCRSREDEILREVIEEEKERLLVTEEIGDLLDFDTPISIRISDMLPHLDTDLASRLSTRRECLRETALRLQSQNRVNRALIEHSLGHVQ